MTLPAIAGSAAVRPLHRHAEGPEGRTTCQGKNLNVSLFLLPEPASGGLELRPHAGGAFPWSRWVSHGDPGGRLVHALDRRVRVDRSRRRLAGGSRTSDRGSSVCRGDASNPLTKDSPDAKAFPPCRWVAVLLILVFPLVHGQGMAADLGPLLKAFFESVDPPARQTAIAAIRAAAPGPRDVERGLRQGRSYPADAAKGWQIFTHTGSDGKVRPYHVYAVRCSTSTGPSKDSPTAQSFNARVKPDLNFMLEQAGEDYDRSAVYSAKIEIQVLPGAARVRP